MIPQNHIITCLQILAFYKTSCIYSLHGACSSQMIHKMKMVEGKSVCCKIIIITQTFHLTQTSLSRIAALWHTNMVILYNLLLPPLPVNFNSIWPNTLINKHLFDQAVDQIFEWSSRINIFFLKLLSQYKISLATGEESLEEGVDEDGEGCSGEDSSDGVPHTQYCLLLIIRPSQISNPTLDMDKQGPEMFIGKNRVYTSLL